ncbi:ribosome silencing factor [Candidatus Thiosymbion oneisti]|uniref:ribosome silencing factor n=1 Tax=Candidatus Thiosymbion oneisti TaxID=589554 RepID=UPI000A89D885|nr:ribosome silencing factor [Candidatus Thiosymbion oneisti]
MQIEQLKRLILNVLGDMKARDVSVMDVRNKTTVTDFMIVASGTSERHVKALAETVAFRAKDAGEPPLGTEGVREGEWALVDLNGLVVHIMLPKVRDFYNLERLWSAPALVASEAAVR